MNYYNDNDPYVAKWLRNLVDAGHLPPGDVDERSILEVSADDLRGYEQCHFFAGIGGWPLALEWAGWRGPAWTGSCPCQPLSRAGQRKGDADERHLWPAFQQLIAQCQPVHVFGEQVSSKLGREWFAAVQADLVNLGYACGAADLSAAGVGAPHIRQRLFWVADTTNTYERTETGRTGSVNQKHTGQICVTDWQSVEWLPCADGKARPTQPGIHPLADGIPGRVGQLRAYGNSIVPALAAEFVRAFMETNNA